MKPADKQLRKVAHDWLMETSNDDCWIKADAGFALDRLTELLLKTRWESFEAGFLAGAGETFLHRPDSEQAATMRRAWEEMGRACGGCGKMKGLQALVMGLCRGCRPSEGP